jgi:hypothetical protein
MAHYAMVNENNIVTDVIVGRDDDNIPEGYSSWEEYYGGLKTSYNTFAGEHQLGGTPYRKNFAAIGYSYDVNHDAFIPPKKWDSWTLNEDTCRWDPPIAMPTITVDERADWLEADQRWDVQQFPSTI